MTEDAEGVAAGSAAAVPSGGWRSGEPSVEAEKADYIAVNRVLTSRRLTTETQRHRDTESEELRIIYILQTYQKY